MKKIFILVSVLLLGVMAYGQGRGNVGTIPSDTIIGAETVNFAIGTFTGSYKSLAIICVCTDNYGGTSDGTLTLYGSLDGTSYSFINGAADGNVVTASPKASLTGTDMNQVTITDGLIASWVVNGTPYKYYRIAGVGTTGDTTDIAIKYIYK